MSLIDTYRNNISRKNSELAKLQSDKANETKKLTNYKNKILSANQAISRTKSLSTIQSKQREIESAEKNLAAIYKKIAEIDVKIAKKHKEITDEEAKFNKESERERKKVEQSEKKRIQESEKQMRKFNDTLNKHNRLHYQTQQAIIDLQSIPEEIKVLFMASNPTGSEPLRLDEEARAIQEMIRKSAHRDSVKFVTRWAVRASDLLQAINEENPDVIHFSGHGTATDELVLQNSDGSPKFISKEAIVQTITTVSDKVKLVFFNTCFSFGQAKAIVNHIEAAIGMTISIGDNAACVFAAQFYSSIGFGKSLETSFKQAKAALMLEGIPEENTPILYVKEGLEPDNIYIVRP